MKFTAKKMSSRAARFTPPSSNKISARGRADLTTRSQVRLGQRGLKKRVKAQVSSELDLVITLLGDDEGRAARRRRRGVPVGPLDSYVGFEDNPTNSRVRWEDIPHWKDLSEFFKIYLAFEASREFNLAFHVDVKLPSDIVAQWSDGKWVKRCGQRIDRALAASGLEAVPFMFILESRNKNAGGKTAPHFHGIALPADGSQMIEFRRCLQKAFYPDRNSRSAVCVEAAVDGNRRKRIMGYRERWRYPSYIVKNAQRPDSRFGSRRVYMNRAFIIVAKHAWALRREGLGAPRQSI